MATNPEAFVYCWTDTRDRKLYIGSHKGTPDDGYVCSSKIMLQEYKQRPDDFKRQIIASGDTGDIRNLEHVLLTTLNAANDSDFYNVSHAGGKLFRKNVKMSDEHKEKIRQRNIGRKMTDVDKKKMSAARTSLGEEKLSELGKIAGLASKAARPSNYSELQSARMELWWKERKARNGG